MVHKPLIGHEYKSQSKATAVPPCGIQPFRGFVNYAAPLCFLYESPVPVFHIFRNMFSRIWCHVNVIRSHQDSLIYLCRMFEDL